MTINFIGLGVKTIRQLTLEALDVLNKSNLILYLGTNPKSDISEISKITGREVQNIFSLYKSGDVDTINYKRLFDAVLSAVNVKKEISVVVHGHPRVGVSLVQMLERLTSIQVNVLAGISSFDAMINDLKRDPIEKGSMILDSNRHLLYEYHLDNRIDHYFYHICSVGTTRVHLHDSKKDNKLALLKESLLKFFPHNHVVSLVSSATLDHAGSIQQIQLEKLENYLDIVHFGTSLFVPGVSSRNYNQNYLNILKGTMNQ